MNERLKELYHQAHATRHYDGDPALDGNPPTVYWQGEASASRFAELIVRSCSNIAAHHNSLDAAEDIMKHFGVQP